MASRLVVTEYKNGRHRYSLDNEWCPGVTTITGVLNKRALMAWYAKQAAGWAATNMEQLTALGPDEFVAMASKAPERNRDAAADLGRGLHAHAQQLLETGEVSVPDEQLPMVRQAADFIDRYVRTVVASERPVFHETFGYAGRLDLLAELDGLDGISLLDFKTGASGVWPDVALQLAGYRFCTHLAAENRQAEDVVMPPISRAAVVWVRPEGWQLIPVRADRDVWQTFLACIPLYQFDKARAETIIGAPMASGKAEAA
jgi:hypothetical protein